MVVEVEEKVGRRMRGYIGLPGKSDLEKGLLDFIAHLC